jgi:hypothetical protein
LNSEGSINQVGIMKIPVRVNVIRKSVDENELEAPFLAVTAPRSLK